MLTGEISQIREAEASAVDSEDFDTAASLSNQSDILQQRLTRIEGEMRAAEQAVQRAVRDPDVDFKFPLEARSKLETTGQKSLTRRDWTQSCHAGNSTVDCSRATKQSVAGSCKEASGPQHAAREGGTYCCS